MIDLHQELARRLEDRSAVIGVVGLGYVGLPLAIRFADERYKVIGFDVDVEKVSALNAGASYIEHIGASQIQRLLAQGFQATTDFSVITQLDAIIICVPTPLNQYREPDLSFVVNTTESLLPYLKPGQLVSLESTTYPGTTDEELLPRLQSTGHVVGRDVFLVYSPEREDPGNKHFTTKSIPKVIGGCTPACLSVGMTMYSAVIDRVVPVSSTKAAELTKLLENIHRAVNIGLVNELKVVADRMGIDIHEVILAASTKPFGFTAYYPGPGLGGHCIPIDPFYLTWKAREFGINTRFIELAGEVNASMPRWVIGKVVHALNEREKSVKGSKILVLGIAYKKNVDDMRESPSVELIELLLSAGAHVDYSDPHVPYFPKMRRHQLDLSSVTLSPESVAAYDLVLVATDHERFDFDMINKSARLIVDTRGVYREPAAHIVKA